MDGAHARGEVLQGRPQVQKGAQSATMYSYRYTVIRREETVATFDLSAQNLNPFQNDHWLQALFSADEDGSSDDLTSTVTAAAGDF